MPRIIWRQDYLLNMIDLFTNLGRDRDLGFGHEFGVSFIFRFFLVSLFLIGFMHTNTHSSMLGLHQDVKNKEKGGMIKM